MRSGFEQFEAGRQPQRYVWQFGRFDRVKLLGEELAVHDFALANERSVVAICGRGNRRARVALESVEFTDLTPIETRGLNAWTQFSRGFA